MTARYLIGDVLEVLPTLEPGSVDLILTSPPFLALRSYLPADHPNKHLEGGGQGTPGEFIDWLISVVEACDRVLAKHGSMVIELGDTYAGSGGAGGDYLNAGLRDRQPTFDGSAPRGRYQDRDYDGGAADRWDFAKPGTKSRLAAGAGWPADKSLTLIPELFRLTLVYGFNPLTGRQTRRWRLRNVIRWVRPNPPVGALGDKFRPATSELMVFCRTDEAGRKRYFDLDAVREPGASFDRPQGQGTNGGLKMDPERDQVASAWHGKKADLPLVHNPAGAPPLDWWNIPPGGYQGAHYAVFPEALCVRPIKAMCPEKVCRMCGEPSRRIVERETFFTGNGEATPGGGRGPGVAGLGAVGFGHSVGTRALAESWSDCSHDNYRPGLVLDPFAGSGTTLAVAVGHGRDAIGIDLDERNLELARGRLGMFLEEAYR